MCGGVRIFGEASGPVEPSEGAFPDPGLGQDLARLQFVWFDDLDGTAEHLLSPIDRFFCVAAVGEDRGDGVHRSVQLCMMSENTFLTMIASRC